MTDVLTKPAYRVGITYCNEYELEHAHDESQSAILEYVEMSLAALQQTMGEQENTIGYHIRMVALSRWDEDLRRWVWFVTSETMPCEHNK